MNENRLNLLWDIRALLSLASDRRPPVLRTIARVGVRAIEGDSLKGTVNLGSLSVSYIQLSQCLYVFAVLSAGSLDLNPLCSCFGGVQGKSSQLVADCEKDNRSWIDGNGWAVIGRGG